MPHLHVLTVWNPVYGPRVMEMHLELLLDQVRAARQGQIDEADAFVWWGKVRSPNRRDDLPHLKDLLAIDVELERDDPEQETHLYITDYRSLYVAHLGEITSDDVVQSGSAHVPEYYRKNSLKCDCWFKLWDIRRLHSSDTVSVVNELAKLRNTRYHDQPVSLYGGMVDLPLIVTESETRRYFDHEWRDAVIGQSHWVDFDAEHAGLGSMERELRENLFGDRAWLRLEPIARTFIATAEKIFRDHAMDEGFDYGSCVVEMTKAVEAQCNAILRRALRGAPIEARTANIDGRSTDLAQAAQLGLGSISHALRTSPETAKWVARHLDDGQWFAEQFAHVLGQLAEIRGEAAHTRRIHRDEAALWRTQLMGIGCHGHLARLACVSRRG